MLRPSKLFGSFHQLRHYFQTKISELVQPVNSTQPLSQPHVQQFFNFFHPPTHAFLRQSSSHLGIIKALQQHFPQVKSPIYYATVYHRRPALWTAQGQQFRSMMSTTGPSNGTAGVVWGFPRTPIGGRGLSRPFSTTKTPCTPNIQTNQTIHISRIFSPAGTKMSSPLNDNQSSSVKYSITQPNETDAPRTYNRIFAVKNNGGMRELVSVEPDNDIHHYVHHLSPKKKRSRAQRLDSIIQHDELSSMRHHLTTQHSRRTQSASVRKGPDKTDIYLLVPLHGPFTGKLDLSFLQWFNQGYQNHLRLLDILQKSSKKFQVVVSQGQLRIYFPSPLPKTKQEAEDILKSMGIRPGDYYSIEQEPTVNHDYFKNIQSFIDHIDTLIDEGPAFNKHARRKS
ncbi:hypothetical protein G6F56_004686 [Rhizopus delemar]|nr:hypothetical protein G6F56_004686 [Rhizopus delemar]